MRLHRPGLDWCRCQGREAPPWFAREEDPPRLHMAKECVPLRLVTSKNGCCIQSETTIEHHNRSNYITKESQLLFVCYYNTIEYNTMAPTTLQRRRVCFAEDRNTTHLLDNNSPQDQWFSQDDFEETKRTAKRRVQECKMKGFSVLLRDTFDNPHPTVQRRINAFCQLDDKDCVRGLERSLSLNLDQKVATLKRRCIKTVLSHQRIMKKDGVNADDMREELAVVSRMQSRPCVHFARRLAKADELALNSNNNPSAALQLVEDLNKMTERQKPQAKAPLGMAGRNRRAPRSARIA